MDFVVIAGGFTPQAQVLANRLRAHGYHSFSPDLYFMDDFGDLHIDPSKKSKATQWCEQHAMSDVKHHHDVVIYGIEVNPSLMFRAEEEGFHVSMIRLDLCSEQICCRQVDKLVENHDQAQTHLLRKWFHHS